ncbi:MAG: hypothetical protein LBK00_02555 [Treponema sp.]|jgi:hypothetical protein|nr:hypothetical protein [Treponema sp.]
MAKEGITISELIEAIGLRKTPLKSVSIGLALSPCPYEALYPPDTLDRIKDAKRGRPPKAKPEPLP